MPQHLKTLALLLGLVLAGNANGAEHDNAALKFASERGRQIFLLDEAGWVSSDEMLRKVPDPGAVGIAGWIVEQAPDHLHSIFYRMRDNIPAAVFVADTRVRTVRSSKLLGPNDDSRMTPAEVRMAQAREVTKHQSPMRCTDGQMNTVVIPPPAVDQPVEVYVMSAQVRRDEYPLGGHQVFRIDGKGEVVSTRRFTKGCLNVSPDPSAKEKTVSLYVTHLLDTTPTEIHVFTSLSARLPIFVDTPKSLSPGAGSHQLWNVDGESIRPLNAASK